MKDLKIYIGVASLLLVIYLIAQYNKPKPVDWSESFKKEDKIPFGTYVLYNRLQDIFPKARIKTAGKSAYEVFELKKSPATFIAIAPSIKMDEWDFKQVKKNLELGGEAFIATYYFGEHLEKTFKLKAESEFHADSSSTPLNFVNPALQPGKQYAFDRGIGDQYFSEFDTSRTVVLGRNNAGHANFLKISIGSGNLYLMASPYFFTNYNLLKPAGAEYAGKALSYLKPAKEIIWDEFSTGNGNRETSPMRVFFRHKELKWAYFLSLYAMFIFILFEMKRRQRIIPVIEPLKNSTVEFTKVVGQVYYQQRNHADIAGKKILYWLENIRTNFNIKTTELDDEFTETLGRKSGVSQTLITDLINQINQLKTNTGFSDKELIKLNNNLEEFYRQSK